jgi:hypothetical protein
MDWKTAAQGALNDPTAGERLVVGVGRQNEDTVVGPEFDFGPDDGCEGLCGRRQFGWHHTSVRHLWHARMAGALNAL